MFHISMTGTHGDGSYLLDRGPMEMVHISLTGAHGDGSYINKIQDSPGVRKLQRNLCGRLT